MPEGQHVNGDYWFCWCAAADRDGLTRALQSSDARYWHDVYLIQQTDPDYTPPFPPPSGAQPEQGGL